MCFLLPDHLHVSFAEPQGRFWWNLLLKVLTESYIVIFVFIKTSIILVYFHNGLNVYYLNIMYIQKNNPQSKAFV